MSTSSFRSESAAGLARIALALTGVGAALGACGRAQPPAPAEQRAVPHVAVFAPAPAGITVTLVPEQPEPEPEPTATHPGLGVACDSVAALIARTQQEKVSRRDGAIDFGFQDTERQGCELTAHGTSTPAPPTPADSTGNVETDGGALEHALQRAGWVTLLHYQADGPDGEVLGWRSRETTCVFRWSWDGGDDADSTYVASNEWELAAQCAPWEPEDSRR